MGEASLWLDGNAIAGLLHEVFAADIPKAAPADGVDPRVTTPSTDETKFE